MEATVLTPGPPLSPSTQPQQPLPKERPKGQQKITKEVRPLSPTPVRTNDSNSQPKASPITEKPVSGLSSEGRQPPQGSCPITGNMTLPLGWAFSFVKERTGINLVLIRASLISHPSFHQHSICSLFLQRQQGKNMESVLRQTWLQNPSSAVNSWVTLGEFLPL